MPVAYGFAVPVRIETRLALVFFRLAFAVLLDRLSMSTVPEFVLNAAPAATDVVTCAFAVATTSPSPAAAMSEKFAFDAEAIAPLSAIGALDP